MNELSPRQREILQYIQSHTESHGYPPSVREIAQAVGLKSISTVHFHLENLNKLGYLHRNKYQKRALQLPERERQVRLPVVGRVAAGLPILAEQNIEEYISLPQSYAGEDCYLLKVSGDSMIDAGIFSGDLLIVRMQNTAEEGEIVVALLEDGATVKRFFLDGKKIRLQPENSSYQPIIADQVTILGKAIGLIRRF